MTTALEGSERSAARPSSTLLPGKTRYPFYRRQGRPQGRSGWVENFVLTGIQSRTVQPIVSQTRIKGKVNEDLFTFMTVKRQSDPVTGLVWPRGWVEVQLYSSMTAAQKGVSSQQHAPAALYPRERPGTHFTGGWEGPRAGLDGRKILSSPGFDPGPSSP